MKFSVLQLYTRKGGLEEIVFVLPAEGLTMPDQITVSEFVAETNEDYKSPTASNFTTRMSHCRNTVAALEEVSGYGGTGLCCVFLYSHKDTLRI